MYNLSRVNTEIISFQSPKRTIVFAIKSIGRVSYDLRHRPSRVVALFHGQQVVAAPLRERGNAAERDSESTRRARANTQAHTHVPRKPNESQRSDDASSSTRRRSFGSSTPLWRYTKKKDSLGILLKSGTEYFTRYAISSGTRRQTRANLSKPVAPRRATVAGVLCFVRRDVRNRVTRRRDVRRTSGSVSTRRADETWRGTVGALRRSLHERMAEIVEVVERRRQRWRRR